MLNFNNVPEGDSLEKTEFEPIPDGTVVRAILSLSGGNLELPEFGQGMFFKQSQAGNEYLPIELTIIGGNFDKRKVWANIMVNGGKMGADGIPVAKAIGLRTIKAMIDSNFDLEPKDQSPEAQSMRQLDGINRLNGMNVCFKVSLEKSNNPAYPKPKNGIKIVLTKGKDDYLPLQGTPAQQPVAAPQMTVQQPAATGTVTPDWAR